MSSDQFESTTGVNEIPLGGNPPAYGNTADKKPCCGLSLLSELIHALPASAETVQALFLSERICGFHVWL